MFDIPLLSLLASGLYRSSIEDVSLEPGPYGNQTTWWGPRTTKLLGSSFLNCWIRNMLNSHAVPRFLNLRASPPPPNLFIVVMAMMMAMMKEYGTPWGFFCFLFYYGEDGGITQQPR